MGDISFRTLRLALFGLTALILLAGPALSKRGDDIERPSYVPQSLLELLKEKEKIDERLREAQPESPPERPPAEAPHRRRSGPGLWGILDWQSERDRKHGDHQKIQKLRALQLRRFVIVTDAWKLYNKEITTEGPDGVLMTDEESARLRAWTQKHFGLPPVGRERGGRGLEGPPRIRREADLFRNRIEKGARKIKELEKRVEDLERTVAEQNRDILELRRALEEVARRLDAGEGRNNPGSADEGPSATSAP